MATDKLVVRLRLDEGTGDVLKNSAPHANPATFRASTLKPEWGEVTWLWPDFRMQSSTRVLLDQTGDYEANQAFSSGGWFMMRSAPYFAVGDSSETLISKMDTTQHYRGWDLSIRSGIVSVDLVNESPKDDSKPKDPKAKKPAEPKEPFRYPTPQDLTKKDLSPNKPPEKKQPEKKKEEAKKDAKPPQPEPPKDDTPEIAIKVSSLDALPVDGRWKHIFFTYDGSGRASGVKIFVNGKLAATQVVNDTLAGRTIRTPAPMQLGWRYPDANPAKQTRYQDIRLYARSLAPEEAGRLPFEDYVAEISRQAASQWNEDQWHVVSEFYLNNIDKTFGATQRRNRPARCRARQSSPKAAT